jgi:hypothetical protein
MSLTTSLPFAGETLLANLALAPDIRGAHAEVSKLLTRPRKPPADLAYNAADHEKDAPLSHEFILHQELRDGVWAMAALGSP